MRPRMRQLFSGVLLRQCISSCHSRTAGLHSRLANNLIGFGFRSSCSEFAPATSKLGPRTSKIQEKGELAENESFYY